jgi:hypothetical protein
MNGTGFIETKNMHGVDGEIVFSVKNNDDGI